MKGTGVIGTTLVLVGAGVFSVGMLNSHRHASIDNNTLGHFTGHMTAYLIVSAAIILAGLLIALLGRAGKSP